MVILTLNCGSSSVKYQVYHWDEKKVLAKGLVERVGELARRLGAVQAGELHRQAQLAAVGLHVLPGVDVLPALSPGESQRRMGMRRRLRQ